MPSASVFCLKSARQGGRAGAELPARLLTAGRRMGISVWNVQWAERRHLLNWNKRLTAKDYDLFFFSEPMYKVDQSLGLNSQIVMHAMSLVGLVAVGQFVDLHKF